MQKLHLREEFSFKQKLHLSSYTHAEKVTPAYGETAPAQLPH
jgi:hypothetical protein